MTYALKSEGNEKLVTDIFRRIKVRENMKDNLAIFAKYQVPSGETPEIVSFKHLGTTDYFWIICMTNNIIDRYHDWPMSDRDFEVYINMPYTITRQPKQVAIQHLKVLMTIHI